MQYSQGILTYLFFYYLMLFIFKLIDDPILPMSQNLEHGIHHLYPSIFSPAQAHPLAINELIHFQLLDNLIHILHPTHYIHFQNILFIFFKYF
jgi:hypothetical protein